jgi:predicted Rdx family selenoprotein
MALGGYSFGASGGFAGSCAWLLRAAYLGTLLAALDLRKRAVVLTLIGGGAFGNPLRSIWDSIVWAVDRANTFAPSDLSVVINARGMGPGILGEEVAEVVRRRSGTVITAVSPGLL